MKTIFKIITVLVLLVSSNVFAQNDKTIVDPKKAGQLEALNGKELMESVIFIQDFTSFQGGKTISKPMTIEIVNYHPTKKLLPAYMINGLEFNDNGKFNDQIAGDGIFTSVENVVVTGLPKEVTTRFTASPLFKYQSANRGGSIGCKVRTIRCPETNWMNSCWPLSSPCTCIDFYECEFEINW